MDENNNSSALTVGSIGSILKQLAMLTKNSVLGSAAAYFFTLTLAKNFGPVWFGEYSYILIWGTIAGVLINFETDRTAPGVFVIEKSYTAVLEKVLSARLLIFCIVILIGLIGAFFNFTFSFGVISFALASLNFGFLYEVQHKNISYSYIYLVERLSYVVIGFGLIYIGKASLLSIYAAFFTTTLLSICFQISRNYETIRATRLHIHAVWDVLKNNTLLILITFSTYVYGGFSRLILEKKLGMEELGIFSAGWQVIILITLFQAQVTRVWRIKLTTALAEKDKKEFYNNIKSYLLFSTVPVILLACIVYLFTPEIIELLYGSGYIALNSVLPVLCFYFIVINLDSLSVILWIGIGSRRHYLFINVAVIIFLVIGLYLLPPTYGLNWYAIMIVGAHSISVFMQLLTFYIRYIHKMPNKMAAPN